MKERRAARRFKLALPVAISGVPNLNEFQPLHARTRDISTHGVYFSLDRELPTGTKFDLSIRLPKEITHGTQVLIDAQARVVRVERKRGNTPKQVGLAAVIQNYKFIKAEPATS